MRTPVLQKKKRPAISPPDGLDKNVLRQPDGTFTVVTAKVKRLHTGKGERSCRTANAAGARVKSSGESGVGAVPTGGEKEEEK